MTDEPREDLEETVDMPVPDDREDRQDALDEAADADDTLAPGSMRPEGEPDPVRDDDAG